MFDVPIAKSSCVASTDLPLADEEKRKLLVTMLNVTKTNSSLLTKRLTNRHIFEQRNQRYDDDRVSHL